MLDGAVTIEELLAVPADPPAARPDEPLQASAPLARRMAPHLCRVDPETGESCAWYHGFWQDLRLLGIKTTPADHFAFLDEVVSETLSAPARVLIAGSADYSILAQLLAIDRHGAARITVTDHCETPLFLCRWYAERQGAAIETTVSDAVAFAADEPFDLICAHSFLSYFAPQRRPALMASWYDLLRPGGRVVTVSRIRRSAPADVTGFDPAQLSALLERLRAIDPDRLALAGLDLEDLEARARAYAQRLLVHPVRSEAELAGLFEAAGFRIDRLDLGPNRGSAAATDPGPTMPGGALYAKIVATRP